MPEDLQTRVRALRAERDPDTDKPLSYDVIAQRVGYSKTAVKHVCLGQPDNRRRPGPRGPAPMRSRTNPLPPADMAAEL